MPENEATVMLIVNDELDVCVELKLNSDGGIEATVGVDGMLRPNFPVGLMAMTLHALMCHYAGEGRLQEHWEFIKDILFDAIAINDEAIKSELIDDGIEIEGDDEE